MTARRWPLAATALATSLVLLAAPAHARAPHKLPNHHGPVAAPMTADEKAARQERARRQGKTAPSPRKELGLGPLVPDRRAHASHKRRPGSPEGSSPPFRPMTAYFAGLSADGISAADNPTAAYSRADTTGAAGTSHYVQVASSRISVYNRSNLALVGTQDLPTFIGFPADPVFQPQMVYDIPGGRFYYATNDIDAVTGESWVVFGFSKSSNPSDLANGWCHYFAPAAPELEDFPRLGQNSSHIVIGTNVFTAGGASFVTARVRTVPKPAPGAIVNCPPGASLPIQRFGTAGSPLLNAGGNRLFTPVPASVPEGGATTEVIAAETPGLDPPPLDQLTDYTVDATGVLLNTGKRYNVTAYTVPADIGQPGTSGLLDSGDTRLTQAVADTDPSAAGVMHTWTQHTIAGGDGTSDIRWYELNPSSCAANVCTVRQQGTVSSGQGLHLFNGAISPAISGNDAVLHYDAAKPTSLVQIRAQSRRPATPLGAMSGEITVRSSTGANADFTCADGICDHGSYAGASPDPVANVVWGSNQWYASPSAADPSWRTRNFALSTATTAVNKNLTTGVITGSSGPIANNNIQVTQVSGVYRVEELASTVANTGGCTQVNVFRVDCPGSSPAVNSMTFDLGDRADTFTYTTGSATVTVNTGDEGNNTINVQNGHGGDVVNCGMGSAPVVLDPGDTANSC